MYRVTYSGKKVSEKELTHDEVYWAFSGEDEVREVRVIRIDLKSGSQIYLEYGYTDDDDYEFNPDGKHHVTLDDVHFLFDLVKIEESNVDGEWIKREHGDGKEDYLFGTQPTHIAIKKIGLELKRKGSTSV